MKYLRFSLVSFAFILLIAAGFQVSCAANQPPNLTPQAQAAFHNTQAIKMLDLLRDTAIAANALQPPLVSTNTTRRIVQLHESSLKLIDARVAGWQSAVAQSLQELLTDVPDAEKRILGPYLALGLTTLKGLQ